MKPKCSRRSSACSSGVSVAVERPANRYSPAVGWSRQPRMFINVDLPDPDAPTIATNSPRAMSRSTSRSAAIDPSPERNSRRTPRREMSASDIAHKPSGRRRHGRGLRLRRAPADDDPFARLEPGADLAARLVVEPDLHRAAIETAVGVDDLDEALAVGVRRRKRRGRDRHHALGLAEHDPHLGRHVGAQHAVGIVDLEAAVIVDRRRRRR